MSRHCRDCKYFGEELKEKVFKINLHRCHNEKSIFKACLPHATGCIKFEKDDKK